MALRVTRVGIEAAAHGTPALRVTRAGMEVALEPAGEPLCRVTRVGMEVAWKVSRGGLNVFSMGGMERNILTAPPLSKR